MAARIVSSAWKLMQPAWLKGRHSVMTTSAPVRSSASRSASRVGHLADHRQVGLGVDRVAQAAHQEREVEHREQHPELPAAARPGPVHSHPRTSVLHVALSGAAGPSGGPRSRWRAGWPR